MASLVIVPTLSQSGEMDGAANRRGLAMGLLSQKLAEQALEQTRVVTNGPVLGPNEALHVDVIPGGGGGSQLADALNLGLGATTSLDVIRVAATYELQREESAGTWKKVDGSEYKQVPSPPAAGGLLSTAFLLAPHVKFKAGTPSGIPAPAAPPVALPKLDHKLIVTITVSSDAVPNGVSKTLEIPFSLPTIEIPVPIPPAICICASDADLTGEKFLIMLPPGSPEAVGQIVSAYNSVLDGLNAVKDVLDLASIVLAPLKLVTGTLGKVPNPYVETSARVQDFNEYNDFDDEMSSFLIVGPTGYGVRFCDTANPDRWDDLPGDNDVKKYITIDILQLHKDEIGKHILGKLGLTEVTVSDLATEFARLSGVPVDQARLGIGVFYVHNLEGGDVPKALKYYDNNDDSEVQDDTESAIWITA
ncbi:hypothetical protein ACSCB1_03650 [Streptomyces europaeiscabiei]|uniref:hypothetical protein n=1 Tax=Streptomyces europaeiscabiei TaxID=146819 RepID=UPI00131B6ED4|nr:hypothetical protein [Streptomyces europaeiscabiei]MDX3848988.1 hypothetical protein [Streptomyces europaeiscabiei]